jgi:hypothetical protein
MIIKKYKFYILMASMFIFGHPVLADTCCLDQVRCYYQDRDEFAGFLYNGDPRDYTFFFGMGCYPTKLHENAFESSIKECSKQVSECAGDKCYVPKFDNKCVTPKEFPLTPLGPDLPKPNAPILPEICASENINMETAGRVCTEDCIKRGMAWDINQKAKPATDKNCKSENPRNTQGSICICSPFPNCSTITILSGNQQGAQDWEVSYWYTPCGASSETTGYFSLNTPSQDVSVAQGHRFYIGRRAGGTYVPIERVEKNATIRCSGSVLPYPGSSGPNCVQIQ